MPITTPASRLALSQLAPGTVQSEIRAMSVACEQMGGINLAQGVCDTPVPACVEEAAIQAIRDGFNIYTRLDGIGRLRNAIAQKQERDYGLSYDAETEVLTYHYLDDMTQDEIATLLGLSRKTVGKRLERLRQVVRRVADAEGSKP